LCERPEQPPGKPDARLYFGPDRPAGARACGQPARILGCGTGALTYRSHLPRSHLQAHTNLAHTNLPGPAQEP